MRCRDQFVKDLAGVAFLALFSIGAGLLINVLRPHPVPWRLAAAKAMEQGTTAAVQRIDIEAVAAALQAAQKLRAVPASQKVVGEAVSAAQPNPNRAAMGKDKDKGGGPAKLSKDRRLTQPPVQQLLMDARPRSFYGLGHIPGALSLPRKEMEADFGAWRAMAQGIQKEHPAERVIVYCSEEDCPDSEVVAQRLVAEGWRNVFVFKGGWAAWKAKGLPEERSDE